MFDFSTKEQRKVEEKLYSIVADEIERNEIHKALWAKALAESGDDKHQTQALYIKYRVQKLKDEISDLQDVQRVEQKEAKRVQDKIDKDNRNLETLKTTVKGTIETFHWLILAMIVVSLGVFFFAFLFYDSKDVFGWLMTLGFVMLLLGLYLFYLTKKVSKLTDYTEIRKYLSIIFWVLIPFSFLGSGLGAVSPVLGVALFFTSAVLFVRAYRFSNAYNYAKKNNLI